MSPTQSPAPVQRAAGQFSSTLGRALFQQRIEAALLQTKEITRADGLAVSLREGQEYVCSASVGCAPEIGVGVIPGQGICGRCISQAAAVVEQALQGDVKSVVAVPIMKDGAVQGFVAAFSLVSDAFPPSTVEALHRFSQQIRKEIDPPMVIELHPEDEEESVLAQLGIDVADATNQPVSGPEDDDQYLSDLVLDVLEPAPSGSTTLPPGKDPTETSDSHHQAPMGRSTEEVLLDIVQQALHTPPHRPSFEIPTQNAREPIPQPASAPKFGEIAQVLDAVHADATGLLETKETLLPPDRAKEPPAQHSMEEVLMEFVEQTPSAASVAVPEEKQTIEKSVHTAAAAKPAKATVTEHRLKEIHPTTTPANEKQPIALEVESPSWPRSRILLFSVAALLVVAIGIGSFLYFRRIKIPAPQQVQAPATTVQASPQILAVPNTPTPKPQESRPAASEQKQKNVVPIVSSPEPQPIIVASSSIPKGVEAQSVDVSPVALTGMSGMPSVPQLPTKTSDVTFGGQKSSGVIPAKLLTRVDPVFPQVARTMRLTGDVRMDATIGEDGRVRNIANVDGQTILAAAAVEAVRKWRYEPAKQNGKDVESVVQVTIRFR